jgi:hypothetical protein
MPFDGTSYFEFAPGTERSAPSQRWRLGKERERRHSIDIAHPAAAVVESRNTSHDLTLEQKNAINSPWDDALKKAEKENTLCPDEVEAQLKAVAAKAMLIIFSRGAEKNTDPAIMRALMREVMQDINRFRVEFKNTGGQNAKIALHAGIGDLDRRLTKKAFHWQGKLRNERDKEHSNVTAMATSMGLKPHHMDDGHDWLSAHLHDQEHAQTAGLHG